MGDSPASDAAVEFAFEEASIRGVDLLAVHVWSEESDATLDRTLTRWMDKYPDVRVRTALRRGIDVPIALTAASRTGQLLVVGTHHRASPLVQALVHRTGCPVALVPVG